jgi:6-phosphogluconolactonase
VTVHIEVVDDPARACAALLVGAVAGGGDVVLAGGSTPRVAYEAFVETALAVDLDVSKATLWLGDERCVASDDERSNYRMVKESLLDPLGPDRRLPEVHRIRGELGPEPAADDYEGALRSAGPPELELVLLGIGPDGHTASLFPGQASLQERSRLVLGVPEAGLEPFVPRVTLTLPAIAAARHVVFLASGESKANAIAAAFGPKSKPDPQVPSSLLPPLAEEITVLLDPAAADRL